MQAFIVLLISLLIGIGILFLFHYGKQHVTIATGHTAPPADRVILRFQDSGRFRDLNHFFHFVEHLIVALALLNDAGRSRLDVTDVEFPMLDSHSQWEGKFHQHNKHLLHLTFPNVETIHVGAQQEPPPEYVVVLCDRDLTCRAPYNKMIYKHIPSFPTQDWASIFHATRNSHHNDSGRMLHIVYIDRQNTKRRLTDDDHAFLMHYCSALAHSLQNKVRFDAYRMEEYDFPTQIKLVSSADVLIGVHGNGLTHCMFMRPQSAVIELFVEKQKAYLFDYRFLSKAMHHDYYCLLHGHWIAPQKIEADSLSGVDGSRSFWLAQYDPQPLSMDLPKVLAVVMGYSALMPCNLSVSLT